MLYSAKQFHQFYKNFRRAATPADSANIMRAVKDAIVSRRGSVYVDGETFGVTKFYRPWDVVPELKNFTAPVGDFSIGIEVECGFNTITAARNLCRTIRNWRNIAIDAEGGTNGIETTFPPMLYSKLNMQSPCLKYIKLLETADRYVHNPENYVGIHVNVGWNGIGNWTDAHLARQSELNTIIRGRGYGSTHPALSDEVHVKYFGRCNHGCMYLQSRHLEFKLFDTVTDPKVVRRYIDTAVSLAALFKDESTPITAETVLAALERGYTGEFRKNFFKS